MKVLILEESEQISNIYKKLFDKKQIESESVKNEFEFFEKCRNDYDFHILECQKATKSFFSNDYIKKMSKKFIDLSPYLDTNSQIYSVPKDISDILEKPFAMLTILSKLELNLIKKENTV
jgi:DNA-binding response OmpR family regulator